MEPALVGPLEDVVVKLQFCIHWLIFFFLVELSEKVVCLLNKVVHITSTFLGMKGCSAGL